MDPCRRSIFGIKGTQILKTEEKNNEQTIDKNNVRPQGFNKGGRAGAMGGGSMSTARKDMESGYYKDDMGMRGGAMYKKGGSVKKKKMKQGYKDRKDESIAMRIKKKRTPKQLKASRDESYGKFGSKAKKSGKINK